MVERKADKIKRLVERVFNNGDLNKEEYAFLLKNEVAADAHHEKLAAGQYGQKGSSVPGPDMRPRGQEPNWRYHDPNAQSKGGPVAVRLNEVGGGGGGGGKGLRGGPLTIDNTTGTVVPTSGVERTVSGENLGPGAKDIKEVNKFNKGGYGNVEVPPKQGLFSRMRGAISGAEEGAVGKAAEFVKSGGLKSAAKTVGGAALVGLPAALEAYDVYKVADKHGLASGETAAQAAGGTMRTLGGMGGAMKGAQYGASIVPGHPLAKLAGGVIGGTLGYVGSNLLADKLVGNPAADLAKENAEDAALKAATEGRKKKLADPAYQHKIAMDALDKEYREALKNGQDPSEILQRARALKQGSLGIQGALDAEDAKKAGAGNQGHPLAALFQQAMANLQPPQLKQVTYKPQGAWEPMQHVVEGVENARAISDHRKSLAASQKLMDQMLQVYGNDMQAQTARAKMGYEMRKDAADRLDKFAPAYSVNDKGEQVPNHMGNQIARTVVGQEGMPLDPLEAQQRFSQGRAFGQMAANMGEADPALRNSSMPVAASEGLHPARLADWSPIPGRNGVTLADVWNNEPVGYVQSGRGPVAISARAAAGGETMGGGDQLVRKGFGSMMGAR